MLCLGFEPEPTDWWVQMDPLCYCCLSQYLCVNYLDYLSISQ